MCNICGHQEASYASHQRQVLCKACIKETPHKLSRADFDVKYWGDNVITVPASTRKEFYDDYLASKFCFDDYKKATTFDEK